MSTGHFELDVLIIVSSDPRYDTRSTKFLGTLTEAGHKAMVVGVCSDGKSYGMPGIVRVPINVKSGKAFFKEFYQGVIPQALKTSASVVIAGDLFSLPPAILNKIRYKRKAMPVKLIYDSKELYDELPSLKRKRSSFLFWNLVEKSSIRYVDSAFTVNDSIADILSRRWALPFTVVRNVPERSDAPSAPSTLDRIILAFSGGLQPGRGLHNLIRLIARLPEKYHLKIIGDGSLRSELEQLASSLKVVDRVHFTGRVESGSVVEELSKAHIGIYLMENSGLCHYLALPNKFFQFISARLPVIVPTFPEMEKIVNSYGIGAAVDPSDLKRTAEVVMEFTGDPDLYAKLRERCEKAALELNWQVEKGKFLDSVERLI